IRERPYWSSYPPWRLRIHKLVDSKYFDLELELGLKATNYFFTTVFIIEAAFKIIALGFKRYFMDRWNQLDVIIVILSVSGIVLEEMEAKIIPINPTIIRVMRVLRIAR
uniref:Ion_trans domain-containing protein n=1 Tax=Macrostomum lignano TaxID=282301 RepID=A0A1I8IAJ8_9PLAT